MARNKNQEAAAAFLNGLTQTVDTQKQEPVLTAEPVKKTSVAATPSVETPVVAEPVIPVIAERKKVGRKPKLVGKKEHKLMLLLTTEIYDKVVAGAEADGRSLNSFVTEILKKAL